MKQSTQLIIVVTTASLLGATSSSLADSTYVSGSLNLGGLSDSGNSGALTSDFLTGEGTTLPINTPLPAGTNVGWDTEFSTGIGIGGSVGRSFDNGFRGEVEFSYQKNDVDTHTGVTAAGIALADEDAAVLISGATNIGATVSEVVSAGSGDISSTFLMVNGFYDFDIEHKLVPYVGAGIGLANTSVKFNPSGVDILDDSNTGFAYQIMAGVSWPLSDTTEIFGGYRYRATTDVEVDVSLFPAELDIENKSSSFQFGLRYHF